MTLVHRRSAWVLAVLICCSTFAIDGGLAHSTAAPITAAKTWSSDEGRWTTPPGFEFTQGWKTTEKGATYKACQTVYWQFLRDDEPADRSTMIDDIRDSLSRMEAWTGLKFTETTNPREANLTFAWTDSDVLVDASVAGIGGWISGLYSGFVGFSKTNSWTSDTYAGYGTVTITGQSGIEPIEFPGRQALITHEVMHAMGFEHVDEPSSVMYPEFDSSHPGVPNTADLQGMRTVYLDNSCPSPVPTAQADFDNEGKAFVQARNLKRGTKVTSMSLDTNRRFKGTLSAPIPDGVRANIVVTAEDEKGEWTDTEYKSRKARNGTVRFNVPVTLYDYVYVRDHKGRFLARFTTDHSRRP